MRRHPAALLAALLCFGLAASSCGEDAPEVHLDGDIGLDAASDVADDPVEDVTPDAPPDADAAPEVIEDTPPDIAPDGEGDADVEDEPDVVEPTPCPPPPDGEPPAAGRWALSLFHYNIQYVAGGLEGYGEVALGLQNTDAIFGFNEQEIEDRIITESLDPVLEMLERNPGLALTFEMQGYMVDVIRERHPATLVLMRTLAEGGQLELASIHWSDQFFLAWGVQDMDASWARTQASFDAAGLPLSRVVFTQEGQFGEGFAAWLVSRRPDAVMVMARNLQRFFQEELADEPLWSVSGLDVVLPRGVADARVEKAFTFFDDGELLATNDFNPYLGTGFARSEGSVRAYERELQCLAERGYRVGRLSDYVDAIKAEGVAATPMPPFLDGTWQPPSTRGPLRWLGGAGVISPQHEADNLVLTTCAAARDQVLALDAVVQWLGAEAQEEDVAALDLAWRELLLGQVSDARGVNPWRGEVRYGLSRCGAARDGASAALQAVRQRRGGAILSVDTASGLVEELSAPPTTPTPLAVEAPIDVQITEAGGRAATLRWELTRDAPPGADNPWVLTVAWPAVEGASATWDQCIAVNTVERDFRCDVTPEPIAIQWPREPGLMAYRPALSSEIAAYTEADFDLQELAYTDAAWTVAADGLVDLGGERYLIKDTRTVHVAVGFPAGEGRNGVVELRDETLQPRFEATWRFHYTTDRAAALELAERNLKPVVIVR